MKKEEEQLLLNQTLKRLTKLEETIKQIQIKIEKLETKEPFQREGGSISPESIEEIDFMNLPNNLRRTMLVLAKLKEATPEEVAEQTNRTRGLENIYLNQLEMLNYIEKLKKGKRVYYRSLRLL